MTKYDCVFIKILVNNFEIRKIDGTWYAHFINSLFFLISECERFVVYPGGLLRAATQSTEKEAAK